MYIEIYLFLFSWQASTICSMGYENIISNPVLPSSAAMGLPNSKHSASVMSLEHPRWQCLVFLGVNLAFLWHSLCVRMSRPSFRIGNKPLQTEWK